MIKVIIRLTYIFILTILTAIVIDKFNFFKLFSFIPSDQIYEVGFTTYFVIIEMIGYNIINRIKDCIQAEVEVILYPKQSEPIIGNISKIKLTLDDPQEMRVMVKATGYSWILKEVDIKIPKIVFATMQPTSGSVIKAKLDNQENVIIHIADMLSDARTKQVVEYEYKIPIIREVTDATTSVELHPELSIGYLLKLLVTFKSNYIKVKVEED